MRRDVVTFRAGLCAATLLAFTGTPRALAQNALGDGRALDANLGVNSGGYNQAPASFRSELEIRNAIVTGNVPGGFAFRGEVGYTAANDFRGALGSNDIYAYQRDSFYSGLATRNLAGLASLQSPLVYSVAGQSAGFFGGPLIIDRSGSHESVPMATTPVGGAMIQSDAYGNIAGTMRSPSLQVLRIAEQAETIAVSTGRSEGDRMVVSASALLGIKALPTSSIVLDAAARYAEPQPLPDYASPWGQPSESESTSETPGMSIPISPHQRILSAIAGDESRVVRTREDTRIIPGTTLQPQPQPEGLATRMPGSPEAPVAPIAPMPEGQTPPTGTEQAPTIPGLEELRQLLSTTPSPTTDETSGKSQTNDDTQQGTGTRTGEAHRANVAHVAREVLGKVEIPEIDHLSSNATSIGVYQEHMRKGEQMLGDARWFEAEERFTAAIAVMPGNALAAAGRVHAQIGAGMYLSAAVNLRNLLRAYPEFIPVRFDENLLPRGDRLATIEAQLRQRAERDTPVARDAALLMAYLGHQYDDQALMDEGFRTLERVETALSMEPDPLEIAIRAVWLEGE